VPLSAALRAIADPTFRPGNFPVALMAVTGAVLAGVAVAWFLQARGQHRVGGWMLTFGGIFGLMLGAYGIWGTSELLGDCAEIQAVAVATTVASSLPPGYCDGIGGSLMIGYYMIAVGIVSVASLAASVWISRYDLPFEGNSNDGPRESAGVGPALD